MSRKQLILVFFVFFSATFLVPISLEHLVFRNNFYSVLSNGEWGGFLGSFLGGIAGSIGSVVVVYFSIKENRALTNDTINETQRLNEINIRIEFTNNVIDDVSKYITDICKYYIDNTRVESLAQELAELKREKGRLNTKSQPEKSELLADKIKKKELDYNMIKVDRSIAIQRYYSLLMRLNDIPYATNLVNKLKEIHKDSSNYTENAFFDEASELSSLATEFVKLHINAK